MSMGDQLLVIVKEARQIAADERARQLIDCPICGETLQRNSQGIANCPMGHWRSDAQTHGDL